MATLTDRARRLKAGPIAVHHQFGEPLSVVGWFVYWCNLRDNPHPHARTLRRICRSELLKAGIDVRSRRRLDGAGGRP